MVGQKDEMESKSDQRFVVNHIKVHEYTELKRYLR